MSKPRRKTVLVAYSHYLFPYDSMLALSKSMEKTGVDIYFVAGFFTSPPMFVFNIDELPKAEMMAIEIKVKEEAECLTSTP